MIRSLDSVLDGYLGWLYDCHILLIHDLVLRKLSLMFPVDISWYQLAILDDLVK